MVVTGADGDDAVVLGQAGYRAEDRDVAGVVGVAELAVLVQPARVHGTVCGDDGGVRPARGCRYDVQALRMARGEGRVVSDDDVVEGGEGRMGRVAVATWGMPVIRWNVSALIPSPARPLPSPPWPSLPKSPLPHDTTRVATPRVVDHACDDDDARSRKSASRAVGPADAHRGASANATRRADLAALDARDMCPRPRLPAE